MCAYHVKDCSNPVGHTAETAHGPLKIANKSDASDISGTKEIFGWKRDKSVNERLFCTYVAC